MKPRSSETKQIICKQSGIIQLLLGQARKTLSKSFKSLIFERRGRSKEENQAGEADKEHGEEEEEKEEEEEQQRGTWYLWVRFCGLW